MRKKFGQSAVSHVLSVSLSLKASVSACWLTLVSVAIGLPSVPTACNTGISWSSTNGYDDQHWRRFAGSIASAKWMCAGRCAA